MELLVGFYLTNTIENIIIGILFKQTRFPLAIYLRMLVYMLMGICGMTRETKTGALWEWAGGGREIQEGADMHTHG